MTKAIDFNGIFTPRHHYGAVLSILLVALLFGLAMLYQNPVSKTNAETNQVNAQTGSRGNPLAEPTAPAQPYKEMCSRFPKVAGEVSCLDAVGAALKVADGTVQNISKAPGTVRSSKGTANLWLVAIKLATPYFDSRLQKEVISLQVGIGVSESVGVYKKPLEMQ